MLLASLLLGFGAFPAAATIPASAAVPQDPQADFVTKWAEAVRFGDAKALESILSRYKEVAINEFLVRADRRALGGDADLDAWVDQFVKTWSDLYQTDFARNYDRYAQMMSERQRETRDKLIVEDFVRVNNQHLAALIDKDPTVDWKTLRLNADGLATAMATTGDLYYAAFVYNIQGNVWNPEFHEDGADAAKALEAYTNCLKARDDLGLTNDQFYANCRGVTRSLRGVMGLPGEDGEPIEDTTKPAKPGEMIPVEEVAPVEAALESASEDKPGTVVHSTDMDALNRFGWKRLGAGKVGETVAVPGIQPGVRLLRLGDNNWQLEAGGEPSEEFRLAPKPVAVEVERAMPDGTLQPYTLLFAGGSSSDTFQGISLNLQPSEGGGPVFFRSLATMRADTPYGELVIYDMNADGAFGYEELKLDWSEGLLPETFFYRPDAMTLGRMKHSRPFGPWLQDDKGQWYSVTLDALGAAPTLVTLQPVTVETGILQVTFEGIRKIKPASILFASDNSGTKGLVLDLATMKGDEYQLPIGRWVFLQARFVAKSGEEFTVMPPAALPISIDVTAEEPVALEFGAPFRLVTKAVADGKQVTVDGRSLHVVGKAGERYVRVMGEPLYGIEATIKGGGTEELRAPYSEEANEDWERLFYPMDAVIELRRAAGSEVVELLLKKHAWFGKLTGEVQL